MFCLWVLPTEEALDYLAPTGPSTSDTSTTSRSHRHPGLGGQLGHRASRLSIEFGRRFYAMQIEWVDWAAEQVAAGTLEPGGALPALVSAVSTP